MVKRLLQAHFMESLKKGKSILLLGPRQTGKTTLIQNVSCDLYLNLALTTERRRFERDPDLIIKEVEAISAKSPLVVIDEIQKVPSILDPIQVLIDKKAAQFVLTGSSARKLRKQAEINLLPGRVLTFRMDPFSQQELPQDLESALIYGSMPKIALLKNPKEKSEELRSYVDVYLEEEVRAEAIVRNLPAFYRFLELAALESGKLVSFNSLSKEIGVAHTTISSYYEILEDCLMVERIDPLFQSATRKKLSKASKYLFFDLGVRRFSANEGSKLGAHRLGELFEHFIGNELVRQTREKHLTQLMYWRDPDGPEIDWLISSAGTYFPIEVKIKSNPDKSDCKHLFTFLNEYKQAKHAYVVCTTPRKYKIDRSITAIPWQELDFILSECE